MNARDVLYALYVLYALLVVYFFAVLVLKYDLLPTKSNDNNPPWQAMPMEHIATTEQGCEIYRLIDSEGNKYLWDNCDGERL